MVDLSSIEVKLEFCLCFGGVKVLPSVCNPETLK